MLFKWFLLPIMWLFVSSPQEPSFIVGKWKAPLDRFSSNTLFATMVFHPNHQVEMDLNGNMMTGSWHWDGKINGFRILFDNGSINMEMEDAFLKNDTLFFGHNVQIHSDGTEKPFREIMVRIK